LRSFRTGDRRYDGGDVELQRIGEVRFLAACAEHPLRLGIGFNESDAVLVASGSFQILQRFLVDREEAAGRAIFRCHVGDGGRVFEAEIVEAGTVEFDEFADNALLAQHFYDTQHQIGCGDALVELPGQLEADDFRDQHGNRLAEHARFRFDTADAPTENGKTVHHGGVAVRTHQGIRIGDGFAVFFLRPDGLGQIFKVHLVADARSRRHGAEIVEG